MTKSKHALVLLAIAGTAFLLGRTLPAVENAALAQDKKPTTTQPGKDAKPPMDPAQKAAWDKAQPGPFHRHLDVMAGTWEGEVKFRMAPDDPWQTSKGTVTREWILDGRFLEENVMGTSDQGTFHGKGIIGYNTIENKYESVWLENHATYMSWMTASYDTAKKTFTFTGDRLDPVTGKRAKSRDIIDCSDPTKQTMAGYTTAPDGKEYKSFEGAFTKKK